MPAHLYSELSRGFAKKPDAVAFDVPDGRKLTYRDLDLETARMANALVAAGVKPGDRVAAQVEKSLEAVILYLGAVRAGGVFLPLNTAYTPAEIGYFLGDAEPAVFVCDPKKRDALAEVAKAIPAVLTLGPDGSGTLMERAAAARRDRPRRFTRCG